MAGNNDLKLLITGQLNIGNTIREINTALKGIEKKINKLKISADIDANVIKTLSNFSKAMEQHKKVAADLNRVIREEKTVTKEADGTVKEKIRQHLKSGEIIDKEITKIKEQTKATQKQAEETRKLTVEMDRLANKQKQVTKQNAQGKYSGGSVTTGDKFKNVTTTYNGSNEQTSQRTVENFRAQEQAVERLKSKLQELNNAGTITNASLSRMSNAIKGAQSEKELSRIAQVLNRVQDSSNSRKQTRELEHQLDLYRKQAEINAQNLRRRYGSALGDDGNRQLNNYLAAVNRLKATTPNLNQQMQQLAMQFRSVSANVNSATSHVLSFGQQLQVAMARIPVWVTGMTMFYAPLRGMQDALSQIIAIDSQLTVLDRVSNGQIEINKALEDSVALAQKLGNTVQQVNEGVIAFARQGFRGEDLTMMAEYATLLGNISDMSVEESASTITAAVKGLNLEMEESLHVINALNEVDNNYAIFNSRLV
ncbi:phage tail tape measure protein [Bacillus sp. UMB0728]|uniref:phage tail tape measure protein n=1 Tax=Bacillus sp. UMB0728 TaxID=2066052 RepID=UPI000C77A44B|nr:phage tail tape measure protein [Bacillus sp. UMB0728]PLR72325.1 phage tail tape measure protein [Bacillus sp. UMB0728]